MPPMGLKQYVPSAVCLKCDGCCRFQVADSPWRPWDDRPELTDDGHYVATIAAAGRHLCRFLNGKDNTCRIYRDRPFECALYPFLLSQTATGMDVYVHLACPFVQDNWHLPQTITYVAYLKDFFHQPQIKDFLARNRHLLADYTAFKEELQHVFSL